MSDDINKTGSENEEDSTGRSKQNEVQNEKENIGELAVKAENTADSDTADCGAGRIYTPENPSGARYYSAEKTENNAISNDDSFTDKFTDPVFARDDGNEYHIPDPKKKKKNYSAGIAVFAVIFTMCFSCVCGFAGAYIFGLKNDSGTGDSEGSVIYQSVIRTVSGSDNGDDELTVSNVAEMTSPSVVEIVTETVVTGTYMNQYTTSGAGSGVIISEDGYIATNYHVIEGASSFKVTLKDGTEYNAELIGSDAKTDLAVLKINADGLTPVLYGDSSILTVGDAVVAIGNPLGELGGSVTDGIISALDREVKIENKSYTLLQTNAAVNPGNSGGGLFNMYGELIAIVDAKISGDNIEGLGFAIPINVAKDVIQAIIENGYVPGRIDLGMTLVEVNDAVTAAYYNVTKSGVYIYSVEDSSLQFESGDLILSIDGDEILLMDDYDKKIESCSVGDTISVEVSRRTGQNAYETLTYEMTLKEASHAK